jgi:hypothetical protein
MCISLAKHLMTLRKNVSAALALPKQDQGQAK